jgi:hypothetical protein
MKKVTTITVILVLTIWEGLLYICNKLLWISTPDNRDEVRNVQSVQHSFFQCAAVSINSFALVDAAVSGEWSSSVSFPGDDVPVPVDVHLAACSFILSLVARALTWLVSGLSFYLCGSTGVLCGPVFSSGFIVPIYIFSIFGFRESCTHLPRSGIDASISIITKALFETPRWSNINEGIITIYNISGGSPC